MTEIEEATKAILERTRPTRRIWSVRDRGHAHVALGRKRVTTRWDLDHRKKRNQSTIRRERVQR